MHSSSARRVLYVDPSGKLWGSERSLILLLKALEVDKVKAGLCLPANSPLEELLVSQTAVHLMPWLPQHSNERWVGSRFHAGIGLFSAALMWRPHVIHLNQAGFVGMAALVARILHVALVVHVRLAQDSQLIRRRVKNWQRVKCIANSNFVAEELYACGIHRSNVVQITNPIEIGETPDLPFEGRRWQLGFVGRLSKDKGIEQFLRVCQLVLHALPNARAVVVGSSGGRTEDGRDYMQAMQELASDLGIGGKIDFLGFRNDVPELMPQMAVLVMASEAEPWGRVVAEAMVARSSVVAIDAGGPAEMIQHNITGLLVKPRDDANMAAAVLKLLKDPEYAGKLAKSGFEWVNRECDPRLHAERVTRVYESFSAGGK